MTLIPEFLEIKLEILEAVQLRSGGGPRPFRFRLEKVPPGF